MNTGKIKELIQTALKAYTTNVYFELASNTSAFPIVVYDLPVLYSNNNGTFAGQLTVDAYDSSITALEALVDSLQALDLSLHNNESACVNLVLEDIQTIVDNPNDQTIKRKRLTFNIFVI